MKLTIFGATGLTGRPLVEQALAEGHTVTALVRDPAKLPRKRERLIVKQGDARDPAKVAQAVAGAEAVLSALGQTRPPTPGLLTHAVENILFAMRAVGVRCFVYLTGAGVKDEQDAPSFARDGMRLLMKAITRPVLGDAECAYNAIRTSDLDWTVVRLPVLADGSGKGSLRVTPTPPPPVRVARADVAAFMLQQLADQAHVRRSPMVTY